MKKIPIDRRAWTGAKVLSVLLLIAAGILKSWILCAFLFTLFLFHLCFFRDPFRKIPEGMNPVSPADGQIVEISYEQEGRFLKEEAVKIGIFLSIFNVHVTRSPVGGRVGYLEYVPGQFLNALKKESVYYNESNWIGIVQERYAVLVRQIAGAIARRIHCDVQMGQEVPRGGKLGVICYGSRVEIYLPSKFFRPLVCVGDKVKGGETLLGEWFK